MMKKIGVKGVKVSCEAYNILSHRIVVLCENIMLQSNSLKYR